MNDRPLGFRSQLDAANPPRALVVLLHGRNGDAPRADDPARFWGGWWNEAVLRGAVVLSIQSPRAEWRIGSGEPVQDVDYCLELVSTFRRFQLDFSPDLPSYYVGFSQGTSMASILAYLDDKARGFAMMGGAGNFFGAEQTGLRDRKIYAAVGLQDDVIDLDAVRQKVEEWREFGEVATGFVRRQAHTPLGELADEGYDHLGL